MSEIKCIILSVIMLNAVILNVMAPILLLNQFIAWFRLANCDLIKGNEREQQGFGAPQHSE